VPGGGSVRSLWKGAITFGLVHIPVKLYPATEDRDVHFRQLHASCHTPVQYRKWCPRCEMFLSKDDVVRGWEVAPGEFVLLEEGDLEALPLPTARAVEILDFVHLGEVDPILFERAYYVGPAEGGARAYALLRAVMAQSGRAAVAQVALRAKESLCLLRVYGPVLALETLYYPDEVRPVQEVEGLATTQVPVSPRELEVARELVERLAAPFDPGRYRDSYREALRQLLERKAAGRRVVAPGPEARADRFTDLLQALEASIRAAEARAREAPVGVGAPDSTGAAGRG
jgi:DNA end-binding protein Ku